MFYTVLGGFLPGLFFGLTPTPLPSEGGVKPCIYIYDKERCICICATDWRGILFAILPSKGKHDSGKKIQPESRAAGAPK